MSELKAAVRDEAGAQATGSPESLMGGRMDGYRYGQKPHLEEDTRMFMGQVGVVSTMVSISRDCSEAGTPQSTSPLLQPKLQLEEP